MSVRSEKAVAPTADVSAALTEASAEHQLAEGNSYAVATPDNPLSRNLVVSIRASLNDLCLQKTKGTWAPSAEALKNIFQQKKFTSLDGQAESKGDLKSVVLHDMKIVHAKSSFPLALGAFYNLLYYYSQQWPRTDAPNTVRHRMHNFECMQLRPMHRTHRTLLTPCWRGQALASPAWMTRLFRARVPDSATERAAVAAKPVVVAAVAPTDGVSATR